ncbi:OmpA family protein [Paracoccus luteus]|uniref:OmpA family protein n=1 Tax=Paracoccus luteus TaxID=2508543 RepID=UPI00107036FF|nr:OmpA family protein [Paracoccus luteus]
MARPTHEPDAPQPALQRRRARRRSAGGAVAAVVVLGLAGAGAWGAGQLAADLIEQRSARDVRAALDAAGLDWAHVATDGLQVRLTGTAPDEIARFRAATAAGTAVDAARVRDAMTVTPPKAVQPPAFRVELLSNDQGISVIGLAPAGLDQAALIARLERSAGAGRVTDLLDLADYPAPPAWDAALDLGVQAAGQARRGKVSVTAGAVVVTAITDGAAEQARLTEALTRATPPGVTLTTDISAPRPVITPFTLRLVHTGAGLRIDACSADTDAARNSILSAAAAAGVDAQPDCALGLGAPSPQWGAAAVAVIDALAGLPAGSVTLTDAAVALDAPATVPQALFDEQAARLEQALPDVFSLTATREQPPAADDATPAVFTAEVTPDGIRMRGRITDERMRAAVESLAQARFGTADSALRADGTVPSGWTVRVIGALEAMAQLRRGTVTVTPDLIRLTGVSGSRNASAEAAQRLGARLGPGARYELAIAYDERLDPSLGLPTGADCVARLNAAQAATPVAFELNRAVFDGDPAPALAGLAGALADCGDFRIEIGAHTDAQGSDSFNAELSSDRAQAVLAALGQAGAPTRNLTAHGYGESDPVAANDTDAGRAANRRIAFRLLAETPVNPVPAPAAAVTGVTAEGATLPPAPAPAPAAEGVADAGLPALPPALAGAAPPGGARPGAAATIMTDLRPATGPAADSPAAPDHEAMAQSEVGAESDDGAEAVGGPEPGDIEAEPAPEPSADEMAADETTAGDDAADTAPQPPLPPTPDEIAAREGIALRPAEITVDGDRITTPVPPVLPGGAASTAGLGGAPGGGAADRPPPRPDDLP